MFGMYGIQFPSANEEVSFADLAKLNEALRANATVAMRKSSVGYPTHGTAYISSSPDYVNPLIPQSIQPVLTNFDFDKNDIWFFNQIWRQPVTSTNHEYASLRKHGDEFLDPFFAAGRVGALSEAKYARGTIRIKFMMEYLQLTDVAAMLGTISGGTVLAQRTDDATTSLLGRIETQLYWADADANPLAFNGLIRSIEKAHNSTSADTNGIGTPTVYDNRGAELPAAALNYFISEMMSAPRHAKPTHVLCTFTQYASWRHQMAPAGRFGLGSPDGMSFGPNGRLMATTLAGDIPIVPLKFLQRTPGIPSTTTGDDPPAVTSGDVVFAVDGAAITGQWATADLAMDIYVAIAPRGEGGVAAPILSSALTLTDEPDTITVTIDDNALPVVGRDSSLVYYSAYVAKVAAGAAAPSRASYYWVGDFARGGTTSSPADTVITLGNEIIGGTSPVLIVEMRPEVMQFSQLLDLTRREIQMQRSTTVQFAIMLFGAFTLMVPHKNYYIKNVKPGMTIDFLGRTI